MFDMVARHNFGPLQKGQTFGELLYKQITPFKRGSSGIFEDTIPKMCRKGVQNIPSCPSHLFRGEHAIFSPNLKKNPQ